MRSSTGKLTLSGFSSDRIYPSHQHSRLCCSYLFSYFWDYHQTLATSILFVSHPRFHIQSYTHFNLQFTALTTLILFSKRPTEPSTENFIILRNTYKNNQRGITKLIAPVFFQGVKIHLFTGNFSSLIPFYSTSVAFSLQLLLIHSSIY